MIKLVKARLHNKYSENEIITLLISNKLAKLKHHLFTQKQADKILINQEKELNNEGKANEIIGGIANNFNQFQRSFNYYLGLKKLKIVDKINDKYGLSNIEYRHIQAIRKEVDNYYGKATKAHFSLRKNKNRK